MTNTAPNRSKATIRGIIYGIERDLAGYAAMLAVAKAHSMAFEIDRIKRNIGEFEEALDEAMEEALALGYSPSDFGA